jgi:hypothetical protein
MNLSTLTGRADIHMHTRASDGLPNAQQVLDHVARRGHLDVIAITDHDVLDESLWAYSQRASYPFDIIPGVEVTARGGHVVALWVMQPIPKGLSISETVSAVHDQGGVAILAHPGEPLINGTYVLRYLRRPEVLIEWNVDAVEIFNAGTMTPGNNRLAQRICRDLPLPVVGNSDAHTLSAIGSGYTRFAGRTAGDFRAALAVGQTAAEGSTWPIIDYLKLSPGSIQRKLSKYSGLNTLSSHLARLRS